MNIVEPTSEEVAAIVAANPTRFATLNHITVIGDRGAPVRLPFVIGNPTGACKLPPNRTTSVWNSFVYAALMKTPLGEGDDAAAQDVLLSPAAETWAAWCERWPALSRQVWRAGRMKCGGTLEASSEPAYDDPRMAPELAAALAAHPRASLRRYQPHGASFIFVIDPPDSTRWRLFLNGLSARSGDNARLAGEMALAFTRFVFDEKKNAPTSLDAVVAQWPGLAVQACMTISVLAGAAAGVELGE